MRRLAILLAAAALIATSCDLSTETDSAASHAQERSPATAEPVRTPEQTTALAPATARPSASGGWTKVGNLEFRLLGIERYDSSQHNEFNSPNTRAELRVRKVGGDEYDFTLATVTLIDTSGVGYDHNIFCTGCPGMIDETVLYDPTAVTRYAYFEVPPLTVVNRLRFEPFSFTTDPVIVPVP